MSLVDFPRSPQSDAYAVLGPCCSHAAYCAHFIFLRVFICRMCERCWGRGVGGLKFSDLKKNNLLVSLFKENPLFFKMSIFNTIQA